ncbi:hypothetical protein [Pseudomonas cavernicola]|uniref:hypothetical protein n=1 Tax=Pseudomonas cavernicola TaxID=2320866 RepID=UPI0011C372DE|nr:hypothetical protein [Pseudomonas cavernicola]
MTFHAGSASFLSGRRKPIPIYHPQHLSGRELLGHSAAQHVAMLEGAGATLTRCLTENQSQGLFG